MTGQGRWPERGRVERSDESSALARGAPEHLTWEVAIGLFLECWAADHPGVRARTMGHYRDQLVSRLAAFAERAEVDPKLTTLHRLRHYFGLSSAMAGVPTTALMRAMGHRSPIMTARYTEFADSERRWAFARADITKGIVLTVPQ